MSGAAHRTSAAAHRRIEHVVLLVLLALIPLRAVIGETHTFETPKLLRGLAGPGGVSPAATFLIAAIIVASAGCVLALRWLRGEGAIRTGLEPGLFLLAGAALVACQRAGQKHLALIGAVDVLTIVLYAVALRQLLTAPWRVRLAVAVVLATAGMLVAKACYQKWVEWPATMEYYEAHREELLGQSAGSSQSADADAASNTTVASDAAAAERRAGLIHDYEARLRSGAMSAYFAHPNILGSCLAMLTLCGAGVGLSRWLGGRRAAATVPLLFGIACAGALVGTQSKGAVLAGVMAALYFAPAIFGWLRPNSISPRVSGPRPDSMARRMVVIGWVLGAIAVAGLFTILRAEPGALGLSMRYRSMYWQGAAAMAADAGWRGVGPGNFGRHFTRYKPVDCPEEVDDPHNWLIKSFVEYGWLGAAGMIALLIGGSVKISARGGGQACRLSGGANDHAAIASLGRGTNGELGRGEGPRGQPRIRSVTMNLAAVLFLFGGAWLALIGGAPADYTIVTLALGLVPFALCFVAASIERIDSTAFDDAGLPMLAAGLGAGLVAFVAHTFIDLAMYTPGAATMFFAIGAIALAARGSGDAGPAGDAASRGASDMRDNRHAEIRRFREAARRRRMALPAGAAAMIFAAWLTAESHRCHQYAYFLDWGRRDPGRGESGYREALKYYERDGTAVEELLDLLSPRIASRADADEVLLLTDTLEQRDRFNAAVWHHRMAARYARFAIVGDLGDLRLAVAMQHQSIETYPTSPQRWLALGDLFERLAERTRDAADRRAAAEAMQRALNLDAQRIYVSAPNRLSADLKKSIRRRIAALGAAD